MSYHGLSSYPRTDSGSYSTAVIDDIITVMDNEGLNIYRMSIWYTVADATRDSMIQHYLNNCAYDLIVCYHRYPIGSEGDWATCQAWAEDVANTFAAYPNRLWIEPINERNNANIATPLQAIINAIRSAGNNHRIVANKWEHSWSHMASISDSQDRFYTGYHYYFNSWSVNGATGSMQDAIAAGIDADRLINTEIGADYNEENQFSRSEVEEVNDFMDWCNDRDISNTVWQRYGLQNWDTYQSLGLQFPPVTPPDDEEPPLPPEPELTYTVQLSHNTGGSIVPSSGTYVRFDGQPFPVSATPFSDYEFTEWLLDGDSVSTSPTYTLLGEYPLTYQLYGSFTYVTPPTPSPTDWTLTIVDTTSYGDTVPVGGSYTIETLTQAIQAYPITGYEFTRWLWDDTTFYTDNPVTVTAAFGETHTLEAFYEETEVPPDPAPPPEPPQLPDVALPIGDATLFSHLLAMLEATCTPNLNDIYRTLDNTQTPSFEDVLRILEQAKVNA